MTDYAKVLKRRAEAAEACAPVEREPAPLTTLQLQNRDNLIAYRYRRLQHETGAFHVEHRGWLDRLLRRN